MNKTASGTAFRTVGSASNPCLVLIHGLGLTHETWSGHVEALSQDFYLVLYDLFGHGESDLPSRTPDLALFAEQIRDLLDHLHIEQAGLVGFSLGGMINRRFALDFPHRVTSLAIFNSPHNRGEDLQQQVEAQALAASEGGPAATIDAALQRWFTPEFHAQSPQTVAKIKDWVLANDPAAYAQSRYVLANGVVELIDPRPPIDLPTLVITCEHDTGSTPAMSQAIAKEIDAAVLEIIPRLRHLGLIEKPAIFTKHLLTFLRY